MNDREKLIGLIKHIVIPYFAEQIADYLIENGVTVCERGRWINRGEWVDCSECGTVGSPQWKRCPVCEAKMETLN